MTVLLLHPDDTVLVVVAPVMAGVTLLIDGAPVVAPGDIAVGHKLARFSLAAGDKVIKYGAPIGSMTAAATPGSHVHMHNMQSDYIASHTRAAVGGES